MSESRLWLRRAYVGFLPMLLSSAVSAATESSPLPHDSAPGSETLSLTPIEVWANKDRLAPAPASVPGAVTLLDGDALARSGGQTLEPALQAVPGVRAQSRAGDDVFLSLRGSGLQAVVFTKARGVDLFLDGVPVAAADGTFDYSLIDVGGAIGIDVFRGPAARGFGGQTLGGSLDLRLFPDMTTTGGSASVEVGSFDHLRAGFSHLQALGDEDALAFRYSHQQSDGHRDHLAGDSDKLALSFRHELSDSTANHLALHAGRQHQEVSLPITQTQLEQDPTQAGAATAATRPYFDVETVHVSDRIVYRGTDTEADAAVYYQHKTVDFRRPSVAATGYQLGPGWLDSRGYDFGVIARAAHSGEWLCRDHTLSGGVRAARSVSVEKLYPNIATVRGPLFADGELTSHQASAWAESDLSVTEKLHLVTGFQAAFADRRYDDRLHTGAADQSGESDYASLTPSLAIRWEVSPRTHLFAGYSWGEEAPSFGDLLALPVMPPPPQRIAFRPLDAQQAETLELGARGATDRLAWEATFYRSQLKDEILRYDDGTQTGNHVGRNANRTVHDGLELGGRAALWRDATARPERRADNLSMALAYTWQDYRFDGDPTFGDNAIAGIPGHTLFAELLFEHSSGFYFGPNVSGVLENYHADNANTYEVHRHLLFGLRAGWEGKRLSLRLDARNLADEAYVAALQNGTDLAGNDAALFFPGAGRSLYATVEWRW